MWPPKQIKMAKGDELEGDPTLNLGDEKWLGNQQK